MARLSSASAIWLSPLATVGKLSLKKKILDYITGITNSFLGIFNPKRNFLTVGLTYRNEIRSS